MKLQYFISGLLIIMLSACSTYNVIPIGENTEAPKTAGFYYSLPRTVLTIDITVTRVDKISGPYAKYASKYLGIKDPVLKNITTYDLTDISINTYAEPDPEQYYYVDLKKYNPIKAKSMMIALSESGLIQDLNDNSDKKVEQDKKESSNRKKIDYSETFKYFADNNLVERVDTIIEQISMDTVTIEKRTLKRSMVEKSMEQKAKEAADFIMKIKEQRLDILTGAQEVPYSEATVKFMSEELEKLEKEYMMMFVGITESEVMHFRYYYLPKSDLYSASIPLFKFSRTLGIVKDDNAPGDMVYIHIDRARNTKNLEKFAKSNSNGDGKHGFYYRIPEYAKFTIKQTETLKAEASFLIAQFGVVTSLPAKYSKVQFYPNSGAIRKVEVK
ncbi:MAG: DUF4831 family protein [Bacteroidales bacterium]|nr:DUF4831 family protein [Bacteroidales bacterium]